MKTALFLTAAVIFAASAALAQPARPPAAPPAAAPAPKDVPRVATGETVDHIFGRGLIASANGQYKEAIKFFSLVIDAAPDRDDAYARRAIAYFVAKDYEKAIADFTFALSKDPEDINTLENRALTYLKAKAFEQAVIDYDKVLSLSAESVRRGRAGAHSFYGRGLARLGLKDIAGGYGDIAVAKDKDPEAEKYFVDFDIPAAPPAPKELPASPGQLLVRFQVALLDDNIKEPLLVQFTLVDGRTKARRTACWKTTALVEAVRIETDAKPDPVSLSHVRKQIALTKDRVFTFVKQPALDALRLPYGGKDMEPARAELKKLDLPAYSGFLPGYRRPATETGALACAFVENGKQVRFTTEAVVQP